MKGLKIAVAVIGGLIAVISPVGVLFVNLSP